MTKWTSWVKQIWRTSDHVLVVKTIIDLLKSKNKPLYACFIDLSKYRLLTQFEERDSLTYEMCYQLLNFGASSTFFNLIKACTQILMLKLKKWKTFKKNMALGRVVIWAKVFSMQILNDLPKALDLDLGALFYYIIVLLIF